MGSMSNAFIHIAPKAIDLTIMPLLIKNWIKRVDICHLRFIIILQMCF